MGKTVFWQVFGSYLKRKFGESLHAHSYRLQMKEIKIKVILYNISRRMTSFCIHFIVEFYRGAFSFSIILK